MKRKKREEYFKHVSGKIKGEEKMLILLDPDTGFEPESEAKQEHVKYEEVKEIFEAMNDNSVLAVFQNMRRGEEYKKTACDIITSNKFRTNFNKYLCIYARKTHALMFLFLRKAS